MSIKLFFFDLEGTVFSYPTVTTPDGDRQVFTNLWTLFFNRLGPKAVQAEQENEKRWHNGEYGSYLDWARDSARLLREFGLTRSIYEEAVENISYNPGMPELIGELHNRNIRTAIVSGGFYNHARQAQAELKITHAYAAIDLIWNPDGSLNYWNILPSDYEGKVDIVRLLEREYDLSPEDCAFIGDEHNDVHIAREVGTSFGYNPHEDLGEWVNHTVEDPLTVLDHI